MLYIDTRTLEYPMNEAAIKRRHPNTSFPKPFVPPVHYKPVTMVPRPPVRLDMVVVEDVPTEVGGIWHQTWAYVEPSSQQQASRLHNRWRAIRKKRDELLAQTDWIASVVDSPMSEHEKALWLLYRQKLRDITDAEDPFLVVWPNRPDNRGDIPQ